MSHIPEDLIKKHKKIFFTDARGSNSIHLEDKNESLLLKESFSKKNVFIGMHIQIPPNPQKKYIKVIDGRIKDYVIPLDSKRIDFGKIYSFDIDQGSDVFEIPCYCAHGFHALEDTNFMYICVGNYSDAHELSIVLPDFSDDLHRSKKDLSGISLSHSLEICKDINWDEFI